MRYKVFVGVRSNYCALDGCLLSLSFCVHLFQDLLMFRLSSQLMFAVAFEVQ